LFISIVSGKKKKLPYENIYIPKINFNRLLSTI